MSQEGGIEDVLALCEDERSLAVMDHGRGQKTQTGMAMLIVVPGEEGLAESSTVLDRSKAVRKLGPVLHGAKLAFRIGVVVGDVGAARSEERRVGKEGRSR